MRGTPRSAEGGCRRQIRNTQDICSSLRRHLARARHRNTRRLADALWIAGAYLHNMADLCILGDYICVAVLLTSRPDAEYGVASSVHQQGRWAAPSTASSSRSMVVVAATGAPVSPTATRLWCLPAFSQDTNVRPQRKPSQADGARVIRSRYACDGSSSKSRGRRKHVSAVAASPCDARALSRHARHSVWPSGPRL